MSDTTVVTDQRRESQVATTNATTPRADRTRTLLACGVLAGPLFLATVLAQALTRDGFDARRHPLSLLSLGDLGWIQIANFVIVGILATTSAVGMRRMLRDGRAGTWGPRLIAAYGIALVWGGIFLTDPADGFPLGAIGNPAAPSWHGLAHIAAPTVSGFALDLACLVFARRFLSRGQRGWASFCLVAVAADLATSATAAVAHDFRWLLLGGAITWTWASIITAQMITEDPASDHSS